MRCASFAVVLALAAHVHAGAINTDSGLAEGKGQWLSKTQVRFSSLENDVERFLTKETILYGVSNRFNVLATFGHTWNSPGADGLQDLALRGRYKFYASDRRQGTTSFALIAGGEIPIGDASVGSPDGGLLAGIAGTWEEAGWRVDGDVVSAFRANAPDERRADLALSYIFARPANAIWIGVLELNFRTKGGDGVLFLSPGLVYERSGWKIELSVQIPVADDASVPIEEYSTVFSVVHVF